jgi:hypothetical protein
VAEREPEHGESDYGHAEQQKPRDGVAENPMHFARRDSQ